MSKLLLIDLADAWDDRAHALIRDVRAAESCCSKCRTKDSSCDTRSYCEQLLEGYPVKNITPIVVVRCLSIHWVVFGNRRLKALKTFADRSGH